MKTLLTALAVGAMLAASAGPGLAQPDMRDRNPHGQGGPGQMGGPHPGWGQEHGNRQTWRRGERMGYDDWRNAPPVDYRSHHLRRPPRGYEWRETNGRYVLAAVATGLIASIILNAGH